jgi:FkbM family methyltransferase
MSQHGGFRLLDSETDSTGGAIQRPLAILREQVGRSDPVILDVGSSIGGSVERFLALFEQPTIHAFEPLTAAFSELHRRFGGRDRIHLNNLALADRRGIASLHRGTFHETSSLLALAPDSWWAQSQNVRAEGEVTVALDTVDHYCAERGIDTIDLLKLDIQGAEPECLHGAQAMLAAGAVRVVQAEIILHAFYARRGSFAAIETLLAPHRFDLLTMYDIMIAPRGEILQLDALYVRR